MHRLVLLLTSLVLIRVISQHWEPSLFILFFSAYSWLVAYLCLNIRCFGVVWADRKWFRSLIVLTYVGVFIYFQRLGYIGVLSGANQSNPMTKALLIGFAFYFLQILGLLIHLFQRKVVLPNLLSFLNGVCYFPKFFSGPIEPNSFFEKTNNFRFNWKSERINRGISFVVAGVFFKYLIADHLRHLVQFENVDSPIAIVRSTLAFELQVYFDFCGYSLMAYGSALAIGLPILLNFDHPFGAKDLPEFWRRWHIGLGRWFHTFIFEPYRDLFPSKAWRRLALPLCVFLISALWHGQTLNFIIWGLFHGLAFTTYLYLNSKFKINGFFSRSYLFLTLIIGRFFFMESNSDRLLIKIKNLFNSVLWSHDLGRSKNYWIQSTQALYDEPFQAALVVFFAMVLLIYDIFSSKQEKDQKVYGVWDSHFAFMAITIIIFAFLPVVRQHAFIYGR